MKLAHSNPWFADVSVTSDEDVELIEYYDNVHFTATLFQEQAVAQDTLDDWQRDYTRLSDKHWHLMNEASDWRYQLHDADCFDRRDYIQKQLKNIEIKAISIENDLDVLTKNKPMDIPF